MCLKVNGVRPPCLPYHAYAPGHGGHGLRDNEADVSPLTTEEDEDIFGDAQLKEGLYISPSAVAE